MLILPQYAHLVNNTTDKQVKEDLKQGCRTNSSRLSQVFCSYKHKILFT